MKNLNSADGFTLVEMLVTIGIGGIIAVGTAGVLRQLVVNVTQQPAVLASIDSARSAENDFVSTLRGASIGVDGSYPISQASTSQIVFFSPVGRNGVVTRFRYFASSTTFYKGMTAPTGSTYNTANEIVMPLLYGLQNGTTSIFTYYDGSYAGTTTALAQPVNVNQVTYVGMTLSVLTNTVRNATTTFLVTTGSTIRNLKTNLGN